MRKFSLFLVFLFIFSFAGGGAELDFNKLKSINNIPIYPNAKFSKTLSYTGKDNWLLSYLTKDPALKVINYYKRVLNVKPERVKYGKTLVIYQFPISYTMINKKKVLEKGVEIIPFSGFYRKVFKANTKIKIYVKAPK